MAECNVLHRRKRTGAVKLTSPGHTRASYPEDQAAVTSAHTLLSRLNGHQFIALNGYEPQGDLDFRGRRKSGEKRGLRRDRAVNPLPGPRAHSNSAFLRKPSGLRSPIGLRWLCEGNSGSSFRERIERLGRSPVLMVRRGLPKRFSHMHLPSIIRRMYGGALCVALLTGVGCTFVHRPYLEHYPPLPSASDYVCEGVAGTYSSRADQEGDSFGLADLLFEGAARPGRRGDTEVVLSFPRQGVMEATVGGRSRTWSSQDGQFDCKGDRVVLRGQSKWAVFLGFVWGRWSDTLHLYPVDDHLVVDKRSAKLMVWMIMFPSYWTDSQWYRYPRLQADDLH